MISMNKITKIYNKDNNDIPALQDISLEINDGEMVAIMGASGSGKTIIIVTHDEKIAKQASRIIYLKDGKIEQSGI